jgi:hypothetical protein
MIRAVFAAYVASHDVDLLVMVRTGTLDCANLFGRAT